MTMNWMLETVSVHAGEEPDQRELEARGLGVPVHMAASFELPEFGPELFDALLLESPNPPHAYSRWSNPTLRALEEKISALEGAEGAVVTASGMAAISAALLTFLQSGDHLVASEVCYVGTMELMGQYLSRFGIEATLVDTADLEQVKAALKPETRMIYAETPANPVLRLADIEALAGAARQAGALLVVDSTWAGPYIQRPLALGADYVIHSMTKFLNGHGDALGGAVLGPREGIRRIRKEMLVHLGGALSPFNAWLIMRGISTYPLRMERHCRNAAALARYLEGHPKIDRVIYPGLASHPQHALAKRQMAGFGGMLTFQLKGGMQAAIKMAARLKLIKYATSLGHPQTLVFYYPTDLYIDAVEYINPQQKKGIREWMGEGIARLSVGLENIEDLVADLERALD
ncbi:MAG: aminotransferase class I/II-fold pyridoxal phosphate-dependent enzyme [Bacillota bacterium]